jgi:hypothetical protein
MSDELKLVPIADAPPVHVSALARPLSFERRLAEAAPGATISDLIRLAGIPPWVSVRVYLEGDLIYPEFYHVVRPRPGSHVLIRAVAQGGGGGGSGKNIGMIILGIVLIVVGVILAGTGWGAPFAPYVISAGVSLSLGGLINALIPPPTPPKLRPLSGLSAQEAESPTLSIAGQKNAARPYAVVPRILGRHQIFLTGSRV